MPTTFACLIASSSIEASDWDACAGPDDPFTSHAYLHALEQSGCVSEATGFQIQHVVVEDRSSKALAVVPTYLKFNSAAEIGADMGFAMAFQRLRGTAYYPKLQVEVPFTPVTGRRLLVRPGADEITLAELIQKELFRMADVHNSPTIHINFLSERQLEFLGSKDAVTSHGYVYLWQNMNYSSFDEFLEKLTAKRRNSVRRERKISLQPNLDVSFVEGRKIAPEHISAFMEFYKNTYSKYTEKAYLNIKFFELIMEAMPEKLQLIMVRNDKDYVAGTLLFLGDETIYLTHWGSTIEKRFLHFEATYYQAIEFAIARGIKYVHAGPLGLHKVPRGFFASRSSHCHWFRDAEFSELVSAGLQKRSRIMRAEQERLMLSSPYKDDRRQGFGLV